MITKIYEEKTILMMKNEPIILKKLNRHCHPNLQKLVTWFIDKNQYIILVIEY